MKHGQRFGIVLGIAGAILSLQPATTATACPGAKRVRWFPLGTVGNDVVVAEIDEWRTIVGARGSGKADSQNLYWVGKLRIRRVTITGRAKPGGVSLGGVVARAVYYYLDTRRAVARALNSARRIPGFRMLKHPQLVPCVVGGACGPARLSRVGMQWYITATARKHLLFDAKQLGLLHKEKERFDSGDYTLPDYAKGLASHPFAVAYRWGGRTILSVLFGIPYSNAISSALGEPIGWRNEFCRSVVSCIPPAALPGHGVARNGLSVIPMSLKAPHK